MAEYDLDWDSDDPASCGVNIHFIEDLVQPAITRMIEEQEERVHAALDMGIPLSCLRWVCKAGMRWMNLATICCFIQEPWFTEGNE